MNNYAFVAAWAAEHGAIKALDFGCGAGEIVGLMRQRGMDAYGCDTWYGGGDFSGHIPADIRPYIRDMDGTRTPYPDATFDVLVSNQVLEHVPDLSATVAEMARVLKPGGRALHLFPDITVWREGHCGIPFLHWFPKGSTSRIYYALTMRTLGFGYHTKDKTRLQWSKDFCRWLDEWTFYRRPEEIRATFGKHFSSIRHVEEHWFRDRFPRVNLPTFAQRFIVRKGGGIALELQK